MLKHYYKLNPHIFFYYFSYCHPFCPWPHPAHQIVLSALLGFVTVSPTELIVTMVASGFTIHAFGSASLNVSVADIFLIVDIFPHSWCHSLGEEHHRMGCPSHITTELDRDILNILCVGILGKMYIKAILPPMPNSWKTWGLDCLTFCLSKNRSILLKVSVVLGYKRQWDWAHPSPWRIFEK